MIRDLQIPANLLGMAEVMNMDGARPRAFLRCSILTNQRILKSSTPAAFTEPPTARRLPAERAIDGEAQWGCGQIRVRSRESERNGG